MTKEESHVTGMIIITFGICNVGSVISTGGVTIGHIPLTHSHLLRGGEGSWCEAYWEPLTALGDDPRAVERGGGVLFMKEVGLFHRLQLFVS